MNLVMAYPSSDGLTFIGSKQNVNRYNHTHNSDTGPRGNDPGLAAQPVVGVCTQRRSRPDSGYPCDPVHDGQNLITSFESINNLKEII